MEIRRTNLKGFQVDVFSDGELIYGPVLFSPPYIHALWNYTPNLTQTLTRQLDLTSGIVANVSQAQPGTHVCIAFRLLMLLDCGDQSGSAHWRMRELCEWR